MPRTVSADEARNRLASIIGWVRENEDEVIVESRGEPTAVIMSIAEYERMRALREQARRREALDSLRRLREEALAENRDLSPEEGEALAERFSRELIEDLAKDGKIQFEE